MPVVNSIERMYLSVPMDSPITEFNPLVKLKRITDMNAITKRYSTRACPNCLFLNGDWLFMILEYSEKLKTAKEVKDIYLFNIKNNLLIIL